MTNTVAIIPARGGSKRLPRKNLMEVGGVSLVRRAVECGLASCTYVVVSSDSPTILGEAEFGLSDKDRSRLLRVERKEELAGDHTESIDVVRDALAGFPYLWDVSVLLQPTSPLRDAADVTAALITHARHSADCVISVREAVNFGKNWLYTLGHGDRLRPVEGPKGFYEPDGAVFTLSRRALERGEDWWTTLLSYGYVTKPVSHSIDVDTEADLELARAEWAKAHP